MKGASCFFFCEGREGSGSGVRVRGSRWVRHIQKKVVRHCALGGTIHSWTGYWSQGGVRGSAGGDTSPGGLVQGVEILGENVTEQQACFFLAGEGLDSVLHIDRELLTVSSWSEESGQGEGLWTYCV